jgi:hypothetical protein
MGAGVPLLGVDCSNHPGSQDALVHHGTSTDPPFVGAEEGVQIDHRDWRWYWCRSWDCGVSKQQTFKEFDSLSIKVVSNLDLQMLIERLDVGKILDVDVFPLISHFPNHMIENNRWQNTRNTLRLKKNLQILFDDNFYQWINSSLMLWVTWSLVDWVKMRLESCLLVNVPLPSRCRLPDLGSSRTSPGTPTAFIHSTSPTLILPMNKSCPFTMIVERAN